MGNLDVLALGVAVRLDRGWQLVARAVAAGLATLLLSLAAHAGEDEARGVRIRYPAGAKATAARLLRDFPGRRENAAAWLGLPPAGSPLLILVENHEQLERELGGPVAEWAVAVTLPDDRVIFRLDRIDSSPNNALAVVALHEAVHQVLNQLRRVPGRPGRALPRWFEEGLCVHRAGTGYLQADFSVERAAAAGDLPALRDVDAGFQSKRADGAARAYAQGHSAVAFFLREHGLAALQRLLRRSASGDTFERAFMKATGEDLGPFEARWREAVTPWLPYPLFVLLENFVLSLLALAGVLVVLAWVRMRRRRRAEMAALGSEPLRG